MSGFSLFASLSLLIFPPVIPLSSDLIFLITCSSFIRPPLMQEVLSSSDKEMRPAKDSSLFVFVHPCDGGGGIECPVSIEDFTVYRIYPPMVDGAGFDSEDRLPLLETGPSLEDEHGLSLCQIGMGEA
ncbi:hypothetical protein TNCV_3165311 [Trichonephila clavipes]|nr:hypothetical protein TNCV_3165311 [Trichonephila clavipes]